MRSKCKRKLSMTPVPTNKCKRKLSMTTVPSRQRQRERDSSPTNSRAWTTPSRRTKTLKIQSGDHTKSRHEVTPSSITKKSSPERRHEVTPSNRKKQANLGQFFTPLTTLQPLGTPQSKPHGFRFRLPSPLPAFSPLAFEETAEGDGDGDGRSNTSISVLVPDSDDEERDERDDHDTSSHKLTRKTKRKVLDAAKVVSRVKTCGRCNKLWGQGTAACEACYENCDETDCGECNSLCNDCRRLRCSLCWCRLGGCRGCFVECSCCHIWSCTVCLEKSGHKCTVCKRVTCRVCSSKKTLCGCYYKVLEEQSATGSTRYLA